MKRIKFASAVVAVLFVAFSSFTNLNSNIFKFDDTNWTYNEANVLDYTKYIAVSSACTLEEGEVCTVVLTTQKTLGQAPDQGEFEAVDDLIEASFDLGESQDDIIRMQP